MRMVNFGTGLLGIKNYKVRVPGVVQLGVKESGGNETVKTIIEKESGSEAAEVIWRKCCQGHVLLYC